MPERKVKTRLIDLVNDTHHRIGQDSESDSTEAASAASTVAPEGSTRAEQSGRGYRRRAGA
jgi:hypothetical protein